MADFSNGNTFKYISLDKLNFCQRKLWFTQISEVKRVPNQASNVTVHIASE